MSGQSPGVWPVRRALMQTAIGRFAAFDFFPSESPSETIEVRRFSAWDARSACPLGQTEDALSGHSADEVVI